MSLLIGFAYIIPLIFTTATASFLYREFAYSNLSLIVFLVFVWDVCTAVFWYGVLFCMVDRVDLFQVGILASFCVSILVRAFALLINKTHYDNR
jgi:hypothetical protein